MKLQFDPNQQFQLDAVSAVADLFEGQPESSPTLTPIDLGGYQGNFAGQESSELGVGNRLLVDDAVLWTNTRAVQERNEIDVSDPPAELEGWTLWDGPAHTHRRCPHFSVEMETGTGKTYVYLRTIFELTRRFGFRKFVIVVPSVAIREGVLKNIEITRDHFRAIYDNPEFESFVYDARRVNRQRDFATANTLQVQVINIQAFVKNFADTEDERRSNVIYKESDRLSGRRPIEFVQAARPIVIIDEPQSVDSTPKSQDAIKELNPLLTLRYSATHRDPYNLVYRLDPIRAFELKLVKQIVVASAQSDGATAAAFVKLETVENRKGITARLRIRQQGAAGPRERSVRVKVGQDLHRASKERAEYAEGYSVAEISAEPGLESIRFSNGQSLDGLGAEIGGLQEEIWRAQIKHTIQRHLKNELMLAERGIKVLSLFFIDKVANYRQYDGGQPIPGKFAEAFEVEIAAAAADPRYASVSWLREPMHRLHDGYFAQDRAGTWKDSREGRSSQDDESAFHLIMRNKELLLSIDEPLRFIFSHSALREGWDNPNVFQICTLNETKSVVKKRQEIGRGLRLSVDQDGRRVLDESVNKLYVMANESYEDFAKGLQKEYEDDCGVTFGRVPLTALGNLTRIVDDHEEPIGPDVAVIVRDALVEQGFLDGEGRIQPAFDPRKPGFEVALPPDVADLSSSVIDLLSAYQIERHFRRERDQKENRLRKQVLLTPEFVELWTQIKPRTTYRVEFDTDELVTSAAVAVRRMPPVRTPKITVTVGDVRVGRGGVEGVGRGVAEEEVDFSTTPIPDILGYLQNATQLTRSTLLRILQESGRLEEVFNDPQRFMDEAARAISAELHRMLVDGIKYERLDPEGEDSEWEMRLFEEQDKTLVNALSAIEVTKSVFEYVVYESDTERKFAKQLNDRDDIRLFVKLPSWFKIDTPLGTYNPDWAIVKDDGRLLYLARETKSNLNFLKLRTTEADKVRCGFRHFDAIGVHFDVVNSADQV